MCDLPFQAEYAKSSRAGCKGCKEKIEQGTVRLAAMVQVKIISLTHNILQVLFS